MHLAASANPRWLSYLIGVFSETMLVLSSATSMIVSLKICEATYPSSAGAAFQRSLNMNFLSGGYVMVHVSKIIPSTDKTLS